jgi:hypothetical protein
MKNGSSSSSSSSSASAFASTSSLGLSSGPGATSEMVSSVWHVLLDVFFSAHIFARDVASSRELAVLALAAVKDDPVSAALLPHLHKESREWWSLCSRRHVILHPMGTISASRLVMMLWWWWWFVMTVKCTLFVRTCLCDASQNFWTNWNRFVYMRC